MKRTNIKGEDLANAILLNGAVGYTVQTEVARPFHWVEKRDGLLLLACKSYSIEQYLEFFQLLVCSSEWIEFRLGQLLQMERRD